MAPEHQDPVLRILADICNTNRRLIQATVVLYLLLAGTFGTALYLLNERASENRQLLRETEADRVENRARFKRSDVLLCRELESLKRQNREDARTTFDNLDRSLRILKIEKTTEIEAIALESLTADLSRNEARAGGCGDLPSVGAGG